MDLDKPLEDIISDNRKSNPRGGRGKGGPRQSRDRAAPTPYVRPPQRSTEDKWVHDAFQGQGARGPPSQRRDPTVVAGSGVGFTGVSPRIEVIGLHYEVTPADLKTIFSQAGTLVQGPTIRYDRSGRSKGEAHMEFASYQQAKIAINKFDGAMTKGQTISIRLLPPITPKGSPGGGGGGGGGRGQPQSGASLLSRITGGNQPAQANRGAPRGGRGGGGRGRGAAGGRGRGGRPAAPANAGDLDKQLDTFMSGNSTGNAPAAGDVDMS